MNFRVEKELPAGRVVRSEPVDWEAVKEALIANESNWVLAAENVAASTATQLREGKNKLFRGDDLNHFEFAVRKPTDPEVAASYGPKRTDLWGRYSA